MYRFLLRPKWIILHIVIAALVVTMINLALWQLRRLDERKTFNREVSTHLAEAPAPLDSVLHADSAPSSVEWRQVTVTGTYESGAQVLIRDRSLNSEAGFNVVTPLRLADGRFVAVERGWVPAETTAAPPAPTGRVTITGRLRGTQVKHHSWEKADPATGVLGTLNRVDIARLDQQVDGVAVAMYVEAATSDPPDNTVTSIPVPALSDGPHLSYAIQWILFTMAAIAGWVLAVRKHVVDDRKAAARAAKAAQATTIDSQDATATTPS